jgi:hypothetical protein
MQTAADAAAIAGTLELMAGGDATTATRAARFDATQNGFDSDRVQANRVQVVVTTPYLGDNFAVKVAISQSQPVYLLRALNALGIAIGSSVAVSATATASRRGGLGANCVYALQVDSRKGLILSGDGSGYGVTASCGVVVNSNSTTAISVASGQSLTVSNATIQIGTSLSADTSGTISPAATHQTVPTADPLSSLLAPTVRSSCDYTNKSFESPGTHELSPGTYCGTGTGGSGTGTAGAIYISATDCSTTTPTRVHFSPGQYILKGDFTVKGCQASTVSPPAGYTVPNGGHPYLYGSGVFFYLANGAQVLFDRGAHKWIDANLSASTDVQDPYYGVLFFQQRCPAPPASCSSSVGNQEAKLSSGAGGGFTGALYFKDASKLTIANSRQSGNYMIMIAKTIDIYRDATALNYTNNLPGGGSPVPRAALIE